MFLQMCFLHMKDHTKTDQYWKRNQQNDTDFTDFQLQNTHIFTRL